MTTGERRDNRETPMNLLKPLAGLALAAAFAAPALAAEPILIGEINHYKRMAAFAEPYKNGIEMALDPVHLSR